MFRSDEHFLMGSDKNIIGKTNVHQKKKNGSFSA